MAAATTDKKNNTDLEREGMNIREKEKRVHKNDNS